MAENSIAAYSEPTFRIYEIMALMVFVIPVFLFAALKLNQIYLYAHIFFGHAAALIVALIRFSRVKIGRQIDVEAALAITLTDLVTRFFLPPYFYKINNSIILLLVILFVYRQTKISIKQNIIFLLGYGISYFGLNYKLLDFGNEGLLGLILSIVTSAYFATMLLAAHKVKNLYRATFCAGMALLSVIILAKRVYITLYNPVILIQAADTCLLAYCFIHWNSGRKDAGNVFGKTFFNVGILPNVILFITVFCYSFLSDIIDPKNAIYGLVLVIFVWYAIFSIKGFFPLYIKARQERKITLKDELMLCFTNKVFFRSYLKSVTR